jgi:hypothetical protein
VIVGYIGLHESDILRNEVMIPPSEETAEEVATAGDTTELFEPAVQPGEDLGDVDKVAAAPESVGELAAGYSEERAAEQTDSRPARPTTALDKMAEGESAPAILKKDIAVPSPAAPVPDDASLSDVAKGFAEPVEEAEVMAADESARDDNYKRESVVADEEESTRRRGEPPVAALSEEIQVEVHDEDYAPGRLDHWRGVRDSLINELADLQLEADPEQSRSRGLGALSESDAVQSLAPGKAARGKDRKPDSRVRIESELIESWWWICRDSDDPDEVTKGKEFLRLVASKEHSPNREAAARYLQLLEQH